MDMLLFCILFFIIYEIDLLIIRAFDLIDKIPSVKRGPGGVVCLYDKLITLKGNDKVIPIQYL